MCLAPVDIWIYKFWCTLDRNSGLQIEIGVSQLSIKDQIVNILGFVVRTISYHYSTLLL